MDIQAERRQARKQHEANMLTIKAKQKRWVAENAKQSRLFDVIRQLDY